MDMRPNNGFPSAPNTTRKYALPDWKPVATGLIYWEEPMKSGAALAVLLALQFSLLLYSIISVVAYFALASLGIIAGVRLYHRLTGRSEHNLLNTYLGQEFRLSQTVSDDLVQVMTVKLNSWLHTARDLFLIRSVSNSLKLCFVLYALTYIGARFNFLTLCILITIFCFTFPKFYESYHNELDDVVKTFWMKAEAGSMMLADRVKAALPMLNKQNSQ